MANSKGKNNRDELENNKGELSRQQRDKVETQVKKKTRINLDINHEWKLKLYQELFMATLHIHYKVDQKVPYNLSMCLRAGVLFELAMAELIKLKDVSYRVTPLYSGVVYAHKGTTPLKQNPITKQALYAMLNAKNANSEEKLDVWLHYFCGNVFRCKGNSYKMVKLRKIRNIVGEQLVSAGMAIKKVETNGIFVESKFTLKDFNFYANLRKRLELACIRWSFSEKNLVINLRHYLLMLMIEISGYSNHFFGRSPDKKLLEYDLNSIYAKLRKNYKDKRMRYVVFKKLEFTLALCECLKKYKYNY